MPFDTSNVLLSYQQKLLTTTALERVTIVEKSRRTGYSWVAAADAVLTAASSRKDGGMNVYYMGYNLEMAREFIDYVGWWAKHFEVAVGDLEETIFKDKDNPDKDIKAFRVVFASGFEVVALPSSPRVLRGKQGYVILDEAAFHDNLAEVLKAAFALLIWGGKVLVISTHDGSANPFNELVNDVRAGRKPYKLLRTEFDQAIDDGLYRRVCQVAEKEWSQEAEDEWRNEIYAFYGDGADEELRVIPSAGSGSYIPTALIEARMKSDIPVLTWEESTSFAELPEEVRKQAALDWCRENIDPCLDRLNPNLSSFFGEDFGRVSDLTVIHPFQMDKALRRITPFTVELRNIPYEQQKQILFYIVDRLPNFTAGALDAGGNGGYLAEVAMQRYGAGRIEQISLSREWYREHMPKYKAAYEDDMIVMPKDVNILNDHRLLKLIDGIGQIVSARTKGTDGKKRHADSVIAAALAWYATLMDVIVYEYEEVNAASTQFDEAGADDDEAITDSGLRSMQGAW